MADNTVAYGFTGIQDLFSRRVQEVGYPRIYQAITDTLAEYNRIAGAIMGAWVAPTTVAQEQYEEANEGTLQPIDEWGVPLPVQVSGYHKVAYPIQGAGTAFGDNRVSRAMMTVEEANRYTLDALRRDADWLIRHALAAILDNTAWTYNDKLGANGTKGLGDITIQPLANADSVTYLRRGATTSTDNHYLATASAIADAANPFTAIRAELIEHPRNRGPFVSYVSTSLTATIGALAEFVEVSDPDIRYGADNDTLEANRPEILGPGVEILGKTKSSNFWIVEMPNLPSGYMINVATGAGPALRMREYPAPELQGFFPETFSPDGNKVVRSFLRYAGFGVADRTAMVVQQIGNGTYQIPTGYATPLPV